jgi:hypothetical protein
VAGYIPDTLASTFRASTDESATCGLDQIEGNLSLSVTNPEPTARSTAREMPNGSQAPSLEKQPRAGGNASHGAMRE